MYVCVLHTGLNQTFCPDQAGTGNLPFNDQTNISLDRQESTGGKTCGWLHLAPHKEACVGEC